MKIIFFLVVLLEACFAQLSGGWASKEPEALKSELSDFLVKALGEKNVIDSSQKWAIKRVLRYQTQVVAGINHNLVLQLKEASGGIKLVTLRVFEPLPVYGKNFELMKSRELILDESNALDISSNSERIKNLSNAIVKAHEYESSRNTRFHIRRMNYAFEFTAEKLFLVSYILEGTNNEISLHEHLLGEGSRRGHESLYSVKLSLGAIKKLDKGYSLSSTSENCEDVKSYLVCLKREDRCSASTFEQKIECTKAI